MLSSTANHDTLMAQKIDQTLQSPEQRQTNRDKIRQLQITKKDGFHSAKGWKRKSEEIDFKSSVTDTGDRSGRISQSVFRKAKHYYDQSTPENHTQPYVERSGKAGYHFRLPKIFAGGQRPSFLLRSNNFSTHYQNSKKVIPLRPGR